MKLLTKLLFIFYAACIVVNFYSCTDEKATVDFILNEQNITATDEMPSDVNDSLHVLKVMVNDTIYVKDISEGTIKSRKWDLDGDGQWNIVDERFFPITFPVSGLYKITLNVNDQEPYLSKWINVGTEEPVLENLPSLTFIRPAEADISTKDRKLKIELSTQNISSKEEIEINYGEEKIQKYSFDEVSGILKAEVKLSEGEKRLEVIATTTNGSASESIFVEKRKKEKPVTSNKPKALSSPVVEFTKPTNWFNAYQKQIEVEVRAKSVTKKSQLKFIVNDNVIKEFQYSKSRNRWVSTINLSKGENKIEVEAKTSTGASKDKINVFLREASYAQPVSKPQPVVVAPVVVQEPVYTPTPISSPAPKPKPSVPSIAGVIGLPNSSFSSQCNTVLDGNNFSVILQTAKTVSLRSLKLYTNDCGLVEIKLEGPGLSETFHPTVNSGENLISFGIIDATLDAGKNYTLSCTAKKGGGCPSANLPQFLNAKKCGLSSKTSSALTLNQKENHIIYDLKFLHE